MNILKKKECRIKYFPVSSFSIILGLAGFTIALQKIEEVLGYHVGFYKLSLFFALLIFVVLSVLYLYKIIIYKDEVKKEFNNPVKLSFFPTISISLILFSVALLQDAESISKIFLTIGTIAHLFFTLKIISIWIQHTKFEIKHMNPAWFIPVVGNILIPISAVRHFPIEVSWFFFSIGFIFWIVLLTIFFNRIIFHSPLPEKLLPTLFILIAPPALGFISSVKILGEVGAFSYILYNFALFLTLLLFFQFKLFYKIKYYLSWWAYSFPIAAITISSVLIFNKTNVEFYKYIAFSLFGVLAAIIILLIIKTIQSVIKREICVEEE